MTAREYMEQAMTLDEEIDSKSMVLDQLWALATKMTSSLKKGSEIHSRNDHQREEIIVKMVDLEREINGDIDRLVDLKREMMEAIREVPDPDCRVFLEKKYLSKMTNKEIAYSKKLSEVWANKTHHKALELIEPILREKKMILMGKYQPVSQVIGEYLLDKRILCDMIHSTKMDDGPGPHGIHPAGGFLVGRIGNG